MNKKQLIVVSSIIGLVVIVGLVAFVYAAISIQKNGNPTTTKSVATTTPVVFPSTKTLLIKDFKIGTSTAAVKANSKITFDFVGMLSNGKVFSSTLNSGPITVTMGSTTMIKGWQQGLIGMKVGGQRRLVIPPSLAYGTAGISGIVPPNETIVYDIVLKKIGK